MRGMTCEAMMAALLILVGMAPLHAQQSFTAERIIWSESEQIENFFSDYELVRLPARSISAHVHEHTTTSQMEWQFPNGMRWQLQLEAYDLRTDNLKLAVLNSKTTRREIPVEKTINTFRSLPGTTDARLTIRENFIYGYVQYQGEEWYIEPAQRFIPDADSDLFMVYPTSGVLPMPGLECGQTEKARYGGNITSSGGQRTGCQEVDIAVAADYSMYEHYGSAEGVLDHVEGILNNVAGNYDDEFDSEIQIRLTELLISSGADFDPWYSGLDAGTLLQSFRDWGRDGGFTNSFDVGQFWSRRNYQSQGSGGTIGLAYIGTLCGDNSYHILEDFIASAGFLRVMTAHELGHNFGCVHNYNPGEYECYASSRPDFIMDPGVSLSAAWTTGEFASCDANTANQVNAFLAENPCLAGCSDVCDPVSGLNAIFDPELPALDITWEDEGAFAYAILLKDMNSLLVDTFFTTGAELMLSDEISLCADYELTVAPICGEQWGTRQAILLETEEQAKMHIIDAKPTACNATSSSYDLVVEVAFEETSDDGFTIRVGEDYFPQMYETSPQLIVLEGLALPEDGAVYLEVMPNIEAANVCGGGAWLTTPDRACSLTMEENFDGCQLPLGWNCSSTYASGAMWQVGDSTRHTTNFGTGLNSFDGSCMLYFDDDVLGPYAEHTGRTTVTSPAFDFANWEEIQLSLRYNFNAFYSNNLASFSVEVYDGTTWATIYKDQSGQGCTPSEAWSGECFTDWSADLSLYANADFQIRFVYDDGGQWAEFVAIDDLMLEAQKSSAALPVEWGVFSAKSEEDQVLLHWNTVQEQNNEGFYIERSNDGRTFTTLEFVAGAGDSYHPQAYFHLDTRPLSGTSFYRLRQTDYAGDFSYSDIREVHHSGTTNNWQVNPNPVGPDGRVMLSGLPTGDNFSFVDLMAISGQHIERFTIEPGTTQLELSLPTQSLPSGVYLLRLANGQTRRLVR